MGEDEVESTGEEVEVRSITVTRPKIRQTMTVRATAPVAISDAARNRAKGRTIREAAIVKPGSIIVSLFLPSSFLTCPNSFVLLVRTRMRALREGLFRVLLHMSSKPRQREVR